MGTTTLDLVRMYGVSQSRTTRFEIGPGRANRPRVHRLKTHAAHRRDLGLAGIAAVLLLPREEEPQIKVPIIDVFVSMPGFSSQEVQERATRPMEKLLWEISGSGIHLLDFKRPGARALPLCGSRLGRMLRKVW